MSPAEFKAARDALGMSTTELAEWLGLEMPNGRTMIREMESGKRSISGPICRALMLALDVRKPEQTNRLDTNNVVERLQHEGGLNRTHPSPARKACAEAADLIQSLSERIDVLEGKADAFDKIEERVLQSVSISAASDISIIVAETLEHIASLPKEGSE